jgi:hypothetical protein
MVQAQTSGRIRQDAALGFEAPDTFDGALDSIEEYFERGWTDGLPVVPVTEERLERMLAAVDRDPAEELGEVAPRMGVATVQQVAVNAVLAGCKPAYFPVVLAATEAILEKSFNLNGVQATTSPCAPLVVVSPALGVELGFNSGYNCFGQGTRANATVGRALRLVMSNLGGGHPGTGDKSILGQPAKYSFCVAESPDSPWDPLHVDQGIPRDQHAVTVFACTYHVFPGSGARDRPFEETLTLRPDQNLLENFVESVKGHSRHNLHLGGQIGVVFNPYMAQLLANHGWDKNDIKLYMYENARIPMRNFFVNGMQGDHTQRRPRWYDTAGPDTMIPFFRAPENCLILCCGDAYASWGAVLSGWGFMGGYAHSKPVGPIKAV